MGEAFRAAGSFLSTPGTAHCSLCSLRSPLALKHPCPTTMIFPLQKRPWSGSGVLYWAPLHQGCFGRGRCQGACCGKRLSSGFQHPGEPCAVKGGKGGRVKTGRPNLHGLHLASLLVRKGREETVREMVHNPCCFMAYYYMKVRDNGVLFDKKSPSSTLWFTFFETQPERNLPE